MINPKTVLSNSKDSLNRIKALAWAFCFTAFVPISGHADDIEIYTGLTGEVTDSSVTFEQKPNILFVLDTSGSMGIPEVVLNGRPEYDSSNDYGDPGINTDVYIYDDIRQYTGMSVPAEDNLCKAAKDAHADNPDFPEYVDLALVWQYIPESSETVTDCTTETYESVTDFESTPRRWNTINEFAVSVGTQVSVKITVQSYGYITYYFVKSNGDKVGGNLCYQWANDFATVSCPAVTVPPSAVTLRTRYYPWDAYFGTESTAALTTDSVCTSTTVVPDASADWVLDAESGSQIVALECELDAGVHGRSDSDNDKYPQRPNPDYSNFTTPNYVGNPGNSFAVDWNDPDLETRLIVPGNYHDYMQSPIEDLLGVGTIVAIAGDDPAALAEHCRLRGPNITYGGIYTATYPNGGDFISQNGFIYECQTRIGALKDATTNIISSMSGANVGLMRFNTFEGGTLISAVVDVDGSVSTTDPVTGVVDIATNKSTLVSKVLELPGVGATPLQETLYEAYLYFAGKAPLSTGEEKTQAPASSTVDYPTTISTTTNDLTDSDAIDDEGEYISPILNQCQDNNIILFSDGSATSDVSRVAAINALNGGSCTDDSSGDCLDELASALANTDVNTDIKLENHVYLHTIGFGTDLLGSSQLLNASNAALKPGAAAGSQHYDAINTEELITAFQTILLSIENVEADSFIAPAVAVNAFNRLQFRNDLYFALFEPSNTPRWNGNIKKYQINFEGDIIDETGAEAVDDSGFFHQNAKSIWSDIVDGNDVSKGGAARELNIEPVRKLFASLSTDGIGLDGDFETLVSLLTKSNFFSKILDTRISEVDDIGSTAGDLLSALSSDDLSFLTDNDSPAENPFSKSNADLDLNSQNVALWTLGEDVDQELESEATDPNFYLGESLHGTPYVLDYGQLSIETVLDENGDAVTAEDDEGNTVEVTKEVITHDDILFATTNQGLLHAIDGETGRERWAYIPDPDMFKNLGAYYNRTIDADHTYGLDGEVEFVVERAAGSRAVLSAQMFMGQRRGGSKYFAWDVTNANSLSADDEVTESTAAPVVKMWTISGLERMGQSWAKPVAATVNFCGDTVCSNREVLFISGGYDTAYDGFDASDPNAASWLADLAGTVDGNAIYMVDRETGTLLWTAAKDEGEVDSLSLGFSTFSEMKHSFPTEPTVVDADLDGVADLLFATDIAGRIWRFDFRGNVHTNSLKELFIDDNDIHIGNNDYRIHVIPFPKETDGTTATTAYYASEVSGGI
ncbi:MAG: hypothetical protein ACI9FR_000825, partial [Cryomorphaceae bacterium]